MNDSVFIDTGFKFEALPSVSDQMNRYADYTRIAPDEQNTNDLKEIHAAVFKFLDVYKTYVNWSIDDKAFSVQNLTVGGVFSVLVDIKAEDGKGLTTPFQQRVNILTIQRKDVVKAYKISPTQHPLLIAAEEFLTAFKDPKLHGYLNQICSNSPQDYPSEVQITYNGYFISVALNRIITGCNDAACTIEVRVVNRNYHLR